MFLKVGQPYTATLLVMDNNNNRVFNDTPVVIVKNTQNNMYFNGIAWQSSIAQMVMPHIENAVYSRQITFDESGVYKVTMKSNTYPCTKTESIEVYDDNLMRYNWLVGNPFTAKYTGPTANENVIIKIVKDLDGTFWNGMAWTNTETTLIMPLLEDTVYAYTFLPDTESEYSITIVNGESELFYVIDANLTADNVAPVFIDHATFRSLDGTDSTTLDEKNNPLSGVQVSVFNPTTKEIIAKTASNSNGEWNMMIKPGTYYFMFERDGFMSVGFERSVM